MDQAEQAQRERPTDGRATADGAVWDRALFPLAMSAILIAAFVLRLRYTEADPTYDEVWNLALTVGRGTPFGWFVLDHVYPSPQSQTTLVGAAPWWHVWTHMTLVLHPPLYITTLRLWRDAFGESIPAARVYTYIWSLVGIAFTASIARMTMGRTIGLLVALALAVAPTQVYVGQELRGYSMLISFGAMALWLMTRVELFGPTRRRAIALGIVPLPMLLTHYFAFGAVIAIGLAGVWRLVGQRRAFLLAYFGTGALYAIIWLPFAIRQSHDLWTGDVFLHVEHVNPLVEGVLFATAPFRLLADRRFAIEPFSVLAALLFIWPWFLTRRLRPLRPWALWLGCSVGALCVLDLVRSTIHLGFARYLTVATPAAFLLATGCPFALRRHAGTASALALAILGGWYLHRGTWIENDIGLSVASIHRLGDRAKPGEGLIVCDQPDSPYLADILILHCSVEPGLFPRPTVRISHPMSPTLASQLPTRTWVLSTPANGSVERIVPTSRVIWSAPADGGIVLSYVEIADGQPIAPVAAATTEVGIR